METQMIDGLLAYRVHAAKHGNHTIVNVHGSVVTVYKGSVATDLVCTTTDLHGEIHTTRISLFEVTVKDLIQELARHI